MDNYKNKRRFLFYNLIWGLVDFFIYLPIHCNTNKQPSLVTLKKIAEVLDVDIRELLEGTKGID